MDCIAGQHRHNELRFEPALLSYQILGPDVHRMRPNGLILLLMLFLPLAVSANDDPYREQREVFKSILPRAEVGDWSSVEPHLAALADYPLLPDLEAAWLRRRTGPSTDSQMGAFLERYPDLGFSAGLRTRWALSLADRHVWTSYLALYDAFYRETKETRFHCLALQGRLATGRTKGLKARAVALWLSAFSQPEECDPVFKHLEETGAITATLRKRRIALALDSGQIRLARYLARPLADTDREAIDRWARMQSDPGRELSRVQRFSDEPADRRLVLYGFRRLARSDPERAGAIWGDFSGLSFKADDKTAIQRSIALSAATRFLPDARAMLRDQAARDDDLVIAQWRVRLAIRDLDWNGTLEALTDLPAPEADRTNWRFWKARALDGAGQQETARSLYEVIADEREYYGFLAADRLGVPYSMGHSPVAPDEEVIARLAARADLIRARELFRAGLYGRGRREWSGILNRLTPLDRAQTSILAHRWGWHSRAISTAAGSGLYDDLELRFPLPWQGQFERLSRKVAIEPTWAYGIARSESLFMPDVASSAGAIGLMQLMPATGKETAREASIPYRGRHSLTDPETNITLGTWYLASMKERFDDNQVLATAAYNAGPHRVQRWLPKQRELPADAWVESIPFRETRRYVRNVLAAETVFGWRMERADGRLSDRMQPVPISDSGG